MTPFFIDSGAQRRPPSPHALAGLVDMVFKVGDRVLLRTKELLDAADNGKPRCIGMVSSRCLALLARPSPNAYTLAALALPHRMRCSPTVNRQRRSS